MSSSSDSSNRTAITVALIGGICTIVAAVIGLGGPIIEERVNQQPSSNSQQSSPVTEQPSSVNHQSSLVTIESNEIAQQPISPTEDLLSIYYTDIKIAVETGLNIQAQARLDLNTAPLTEIFTGEALRLELAIIETLREKEWVVASIQKDLKYGIISVTADATRAEVRVNPTWESTTFLIPTGECVVYMPPTEQPQTVYLERTASTWMIYLISRDDQESNPWGPCPHP